ncbi:hypothetical protein SAMN05421866_4208 [Chryseobacterium oranimense]|uniref:Uncharacterized protein n=1 Tax=Chryseobacterium oranimense TaxID=421058 RepID=A0A1M5WS80_9FLAO|nr:hypothetical protein [Chryseobacterium oranimense]SHH90242.1 hypothetical protein SAMN05421866_4208 [Chryseobacterium oranimense]
MKQLDLELQKRLLIVESENETQARIYGYGKYGALGIKFICKGPDLTEDIAKGLVNGMYPEHYVLSIGISQLYQSGIATYIGDPLKAFVEQLKSKGYYWGENPVKHPENMAIIPASLGWWLKQAKKHDEAESRTFNLEKTRIFEIL